MPSVAEINAYLELSAARTRMRLPLAKGAMIVPPKAAPPAPAATAPGSNTSRALPLQSSKKAPSPAEPSAPAAEPGEWRPFGGDDER
jgi:hypothetical protein